MNDFSRPFVTAPETYDVLVIGTGLAGITAAFRCAKEQASVLLCSKTRLCSGSSFYPLMDTIHCQCTMGPEDEAIFLQDIAEAGKGMNDPWMNQYYVRHIRESLSFLSQIGIPVYKLPEPKLACFASHPHDLFFWKNWEEIRRILYTRAEEESTLTLKEYISLCCLITADGQAAGAVFYDSRQDLYVYVKARRIILASGGFGALYKHNLNSADVAGEGHSAALKAGAPLINLEFNQFIPGFLSPVYKVVFREGSLDYCQGLYDEEGNELLSHYLAKEEIKNCLAKRAPHGPFTTSDGSAPFDLALFEGALRAEERGVRIEYDPAILSDSRSYIADYTAWLKSDFGLDISKDPIRIAPFFHAANGGILVDHRCETGVRGMFACGECAGGIHGADRLGGNASGSCLVFGFLAAQSALADASASLRFPGRDDAFHQFHACFSKEEDRNLLERDIAESSLRNPDQIITRVKELLWRYGNVVRREDLLKKACEEMEEMKTHYCAWDFLSAPDADPKQTQKALLAEHFLTLAPAILESMRARRESRGSHYREDYPSMDSAYTLRFAARLENGRIQLEKRPAILTLPPAE